MSDLRSGALTDWQQRDQAHRESRDEFIELLQAQASDLITREQASQRLRAIRPEWFAEVAE